MPPHIESITDPATGSEARILVSLGFNCFSWRPTLTDGPREMLWAHPKFTGGRERPSGSGIPLLFPFPGRIGAARFSFNGRDYWLEPDDKFGNAIHGFVHCRPWRVVEKNATRVVGEFHASRDDRSILERWPCDFRIRVSYEVNGGELVSDIEYENSGGGPLPCGFGTHTYFRLPLADGGAIEETLVTAPVAKVWETVDMLPTGRLFDAEGDRALSNGGPLAGRQFDTCYTDLAAESDGLVRTLLADPSSGRALTQTFDAAFKQCIVYTPPHREAICLEPYTCVPDSFRLAAEGHATGQQILQPGEKFATMIRLGVSS
jgi:aldose 1-epimerase